MRQGGERKRGWIGIKYGKRKKEERIRESQGRKREYVKDRLMGDWII